MIEDFWPDWPNPDGKRFRYSEDGDINHAIRNILFDDAMLTEKGPFNYMILNGREEREQESRVEKKTGLVIKITKGEGLKGEDLWWQMADDLLFQL